MSTIDRIAALAGRLARETAERARRGLARSDATLRRVKTEAGSRRAMMDKALREKQAKRGK